MHIFSRYSMSGLAAAALCLSCNSGETTLAGDGGSSASEGASASSASSIFPLAQDIPMGLHGDSLFLGIIYRDFSVTHDDFEVFDAAWPALGLGDRQCAEDKEGGREVAGAAYICQDYKECSKSEVPDNVLLYGEMSNPSLGETKRGYIHELKAEGWMNRNWSQAVMVTQGMVAPLLDYSLVPASARNRADSAFYARPVKLRDNACHNTKFNEWFTDVKGVNKRVDDHLALTALGDGSYSFVADRNNESLGFFPLDAYAEGPKDTYGKQSLSIWCRPDFSWQEALPLEEKEEMGESLGSDERAYVSQLRAIADYPDPGCAYWQSFGGAKDHEAAKKASIAAPSLLGFRLHNFGYTMSAVLLFKYHPEAQNGMGEWLRLVSDDDTWIFVDGLLAADLGGAHVSAPALLRMNELGAERNWTAGSTHVINIFKAERNTDESSFSVSTNLSSVLSASDL